MSTHYVQVEDQKKRREAWEKVKRELEAAVAKAEEQLRRNKALHTNKQTRNEPTSDDRAEMNPLEAAAQKQNSKPPHRILWTSTVLALLLRGRLRGMQRQISRIGCRWTSTL